MRFFWYAGLFPWIVPATGFAVPSPSVVSTVYTGLTSQEASPTRVSMVATEFTTGEIARKRTREVCSVFRDGRCSGLCQLILVAPVLVLLGNHERNVWRWPQKVFRCM